jgi:hypothetical protein
LLDRRRSTYKELMGEYGMLTLRLSKRKSMKQKQQQYSFSLLSAISDKEVVGNWVIEGAFNGVLYEHFLRVVITEVQRRPENAYRRIVVFMDNARIHKHPLVLETLRHLQVDVLFNAEYSPTLNPIE